MGIRKDFFPIIPVPSPLGCEGGNSLFLNSFFDEELFMNGFSPSPPVERVRVWKSFILHPNITSFMRYMKWIGPAAAVLLIVSCFSPWVFIESRNITVSGVDTIGTNFGKPGYFHFILTSFFLIFSFMQKVGAKRANLLITALNFGWAIRNYFIISACQGGDCPLKKTGIYLMLLGSILMMVSALFPDMKLPEGKDTGNNKSNNPPVR